MSVYRVQETIDDAPVAKPEDVILPNEDLIIHDLPGRHEFTAKLFTTPPERGKASWAAFLEQAFGRLDEITANVATAQSS